MEFCLKWVHMARYGLILSSTASNGAEPKDAIRQLIFLWAGWRDPAKIDIFLTTPSWALTPEILSIYGIIAAADTWRTLRTQLGPAPLPSRYQRHCKQPLRGALAANRVDNMLRHRNLSC